MMELTSSKDIEIRFSEVDMMKVVWHGAYPLYLEDAREAFGDEYGLTYEGYLDNQYYAPIVDMQIQYKFPLRYGVKARIDITYRPTEAAKIVFDYEIRDKETNLLYCKARTIQVFMDMDYNLVLFNPEFFENWKAKWQQ
ncbi:MULTISPECIES: acyl-CoA thioesterase [Bacteroidales]|uniref:4-hydroxybenzoyl-CoA thioesterase n=1 Tax=Muribaculum intestinale TaxID=1796646 RepID=A0A1B1S9A5_9BACT|nr:MULTISPECIES: acyl-CoA thioesterase [Bacteroidales]RLT76312.1 acyl-CoA thioesterase [bacterium J10(2018)]ANU63369.1 4-hydroxybenzoyl-CoA thioesterase [Muribaculum intestinale]ASB38548.1 4-hydroxybenzoyl-CoA thioesterase [Muribaculum intestinale]PWB08106.1 acyl-CoA thioesterase [Muribaculum intestinale]QQR10289.1 acyl-CoA thioesterase [Muribaculum intestinale]